MLDKIAKGLIRRVQSVSKPSLALPGARKREPHDPFGIRSFGDDLLQKCVAQGTSEQDIIWRQILPTAASFVTDLSTLFSLALEYYLTDGAAHVLDVTRVAQLNPAQGDNLLLR